MSRSDPKLPPKAPLSVVVLGASGDLARKKIFPALFSLHSQDLLPDPLRIFGFARRAMDNSAFRASIAGNLTCRYVPRQSCGERIERFLERCEYVTGGYDSADSFLDLYAAMRAAEGDTPANRLYYMAIPPFLFLDVARSIGQAGLVDCGGTHPGFSRAVIEKPFGRDRESSDALVSDMAQIFAEDQTYRIDHYLGKEVIQNLIVLRFANRVFEPIWNRTHVSDVRISFEEDFGAEGRGGYFDNYGIIRDIMQSHLVQILALLAIEQPRRLNAHEIRDEKVRVLRAVRPLEAGDFVLGQYRAARGDDGLEHPGYTDDPGVPDDSLTPTFAQTVLRIDNDRWEGVPFIMSAGKALKRRMTEIRVRFRPVAHDIFGPGGGLEPNELIIRVQPDEAIYLRIATRTPGLAGEIAERDLNLRYESAFDAVVPEAYESLILDVIRGERSLFIRRDELEAAWDIFTPALREMDERGVRPEPYDFGSAGPAAAGQQTESACRPR